MDATQRLAYLFRRFLNKECTPQEKEEFFALLLQTEHDDTLRRLIADTWNEHLPFHPQDKDRADTILRHILSRREPESPPESLDPPSGPPVIVRRLRTILLTPPAAAAILGIFLFSMAVFHFHHRAHPLTAADTSPALGASQQPAADRCITLPDGSKVLLHNKARLDYTAGFNPTRREVILHGEAYFDIHRDTRPFIVQTGAIRTTVLGTAFNIDANDERNITITVTKGKVKVENGRGEYSILHRNEQLSVDSVHSHLQIIPVNASEALTWKKTWLLFNDVPLREAMDTLAQRYHFTVVFTNPAAENCPVTATFTGGEPLEQMVNVLSKINNMEYTIDHGRITITGEGCK